MDLLWKHVADLLGYSLPDREIHEISLVGSPFWTSLHHCNKDSVTCKSHLQSHAIYLLFKCSLILIRNDLESPRRIGSVDGFRLASEYEKTVLQLSLKVESRGQMVVETLKYWLLRQISYVSEFTGDVFRNRCNKLLRILLCFFLFWVTKMECRPRADGEEF